MSTINRPIAGNYNAIETSRKALSAKADSVFSYRNVNPYSIAFDKFKREGNENLREDLWTQASNKGELDQYINLLISNPKKSSKLAELTDKYADRVDYDTAMLALSYDAIKDDVAEERYDSAGNSLGKMTQRELMDKVFANQAQRWDVQIAEDAKKSRTFWEKAWFTVRAPFAQTGANIIDIVNGINRWISLSGNFLQAGVMTIIDRVEGKVKTDKEIIEAWVSYTSNRYINDPQLNVGGARGDNALSLITKANAAYEQAAYDIRRKYTYSVDPTTGEYNWWGKIMHGMSDSIGFMAGSMFGGGPAAMYLPMFTQNVIENVQMTGYNTDYTKLMTNAGIKTGIEYAIELALGKLIGFSKKDKLIGYSDDALRVTQQAVTKGITATGKEAAKQWALASAKDMVKEGLEEVFQDMSGMAIDYMYGDEYKARGKEGATLENFGQAFIVGAATSLVIGSFTTMTTKSTIGVDETGLTYTMGKFQTYTYKQALATLNSWQQIANDAKADPSDRITAALKLDGVTASLGTLYESLGLENTIKAEKLLLDMQAYHDKKTSIKDSVAKGTYVKDLMSGLTTETDGENEVGGNKWLKAFNTVNARTTELFTNLNMAQNQGPGKVFESFAKSLQKSIVQQKLQDSGATKIETPIDLTDNTQIIPESIRDVARRLGFNILVKTDGKDVIIDEDVIFTPLDIEDSDTQSLIKEVATQKTIMNIAKAIPASLLKAVIDTYKTSVGTATGHYTEATVEQQAIAALMFDKNFQLKMLLQSHKNSHDWGTKQVIDFIKNLKKHIAKTYTTSATEKTESGKPKRVLSDITKNITERVVKSLQDSIVVFNLTTARSTTYDVTQNKVVIDANHNEALEPEQISKIVTDFNVRASSMLDAAKKTQLKPTPELESMLEHMATQIIMLQNRSAAYNGVIRGLVQAKFLTNYYPSLIELSDAMFKVLTTGNLNQRSDLVATLTYIFQRNLTKSKVYYIPRTNTNLHLFTAADKIVADIESTLLGNQQLEKVISGRADLRLVAESLLNSDPAFIIDPQVRFLQLDNLIKQKSNNQFAILANGTLIKVEHDRANMVSSIANATTTDELIKELYALRNSKPDNILRLQDLFKINLGPMGKLAIIFADSNNMASGYYAMPMGLIALHIDKRAKYSGEAISILFHEMIHAANSVLYDNDIRHKLIGGGPSAFARQLDPLRNRFTSDYEVDRLIKYLETNFPIISAYTIGLLDDSKLDITDSTLFLMRAMYFLSQEEVAARSMAELYEFSALGFKTDIDAHGNISLVAPDNSTYWKLNESGPLELGDLAILRGQLTLISPTTYQEKQILQALRNANSVEELQNLTKQLLLPIIETGSAIKLNYIDTIVTMAEREAARLQLPSVKTADLIKELRSEFTHLTKEALAIDMNDSKNGLDKAKRLYNTAKQELTKLIFTANKDSYASTKMQVYYKIAEMFENAIIPAIESELFAATVYAAVHHSFVPAKRTTFAGMPVTKQHNPSEFLSNQSEVISTEKTLQPPKFDSMGIKLTKTQSEFFKNTIVRDENGNLLRVYHGTTASEDFDTFTSNKTTNGKSYGAGIYFSPSVHDAAFYAESGRFNNDGPIPTANGKILPVYLNITNPIEYKSLAQMRRKVINFNKIKPNEDGVHIITTEHIDAYHDMLRKTQNKDGVIARHKGNLNALIYAVFDSNQIKSTLNNSPTLQPMINASEIIDPTNEQKDPTGTGTTTNHFNFGEYSLVKYTGRSYMLTKQNGPRSITQEVDMQTLLPVRNGQKPLLDQAMRDRMRLVIDKKLAVAKKAASEPKLPVPEKKTKDGEVVFEAIASPIVVKVYDKDHYIVTKRIDKGENDEDTTKYTQTQIVNKHTLLPDTMLGSLGKPILSDTERSNLQDWIMHKTGPKIFKVQEKDSDKEKYIYVPNLTKKTKSDAQLKEDFEDEIANNPLFDNLPGNMGAYYENKDSLAFYTDVAKFYKKYPNLRSWVEGMVDKTQDQYIEAKNAKVESLVLLFKELYQNTYNQTGTFKDFTTTPIYFVRTMNTNKVKMSGMNSVSLGYDLARIPVFGQKTDYVYFGTLLPNELLTYLPLSYAEGIVSSEVFSKNKAMTYADFEQLVAKETKGKRVELVPNKFDELSFANNESTMFEAPRAKRTYISQTRAKKSNLIYLFNRAKAKGQLFQPHDDVVAFVEATTDNFDQLSQFFKVRIKNGTLTRHDITEYIATTDISKINDYTWKAIVKYIYKNEALEAIGPAVAEFLIDTARLEKLAIIARMTTDEAQANRVHTLASFKQLMNQFDLMLKKNDPEFVKRYEKVKKQVDSWWAYDAEGKLIKDEYIMEQNQIFPIFMSLFRGSLKSINDVFTYAKVVSGKQNQMSVRDNTGSTDSTDDNANKTTKISSGNAAVENNNVAKEKNKGPYNWQAHIRKNVINYELTGYAPAEIEEEFTTIEEMTTDQKYNLIYNYLYEDALSYLQAGKKPSEQEQSEAHNEVVEIMDEMSEEQILSTIRYILDEKINAIQLKKAAEATKIVPDGPSAERKVAKDFLRNKTNLLIKKLAGSKVAYNKLSTEVQALINFTPLNSRMNPEAYTNKSNAELAELTNKVKAEIDRINTTMKAARDAEKVKATALRKLASLQKREAALLEREAKVKERAKAIKEGTNLRGKIHISYETKVAKESFTITGPSKINSKLQAILDRTWDKTTTSKVKYMADSLQTIQNVHTAEEFYAEHAGVLSNMTLSEIEDITDWLIKANINTTDSAARQTFEAVRFFMLAYIYNETGAEKMFMYMNSNLKTQLGEYLKSIQTTAGTLLSLVNQVKGKLNPAAIIARELFANFSYQLTEAEEAELTTALNTGDTVAITKVLHDIKQNALKTFAPTKASALRKIVAIRSMSMTSSPMTWVRNITSNYVISKTNRLSAKIGALFFPKLTKNTELTPQYKLDKPITPEIQDFITKQFIESGFFEETLDQLSKYNPSQVLRHKKVDSYDVIENMLIHAIYNEYYTKEMFDNKMLNKIHQFLMKRLSDKNFVREAAVRYLGKLLAETGHHLDENGQLKTAMDKDVNADVARAFGLAARDYMHSDNAFSHLEKWLSEHSTGMWAVYKAIMPFATASWNWFKAATKYTPVGLGQAIVKLTRVEQEIAKQEALWQKGDSQTDPALTSYILTRDLGSGIIGTIAFGFGAILAALGYISLEDDDWGTPKLQIGNLRIDVSTIFGSSSALAGAAFIKTLQQKDLESALDAMIDPLVDGFFFTDLLLLDANAPKGWFEWSKYQLQSIALSFIPSMVRYVSGATYTGTYKTNSMFERAVARLPFLGQAFNVPKRTNVYTGDTEGTMWDIVHRMLPYFEMTTKSQAQTTTEMYGLNKEELHGTYMINGLSFKTGTKETARINKLYGELNADDLTAFYANESAYRVLTENNKYVTKRYSQMTPTEISNALDQIFSKNSNIAKISAWLAGGHTYYTNDREIFNMMRKLGYTKVYIGNKGFVN